MREVWIVRTVTGHKITQNGYSAVSDRYRWLEIWPDTLVWIGSYRYCNTKRNRERHNENSAWSDGYVACAGRRNGRIGIVVDGAGPDGSLRGEAAKAGIATIIYEAGEPLRFEEDEIDRGMRGVHNVMAFLDVTDQADQIITENRVYQRSKWVRATRGHGGFSFPTAKLGDVDRRGDLLGRIIDPLTDEGFEVVSPLEGEVIGMAVPQPVLSGYGLVYLAWHDSD